MAAGAFVFYDSGTKVIVDGTVDLDTDTIACWLATSSYTPNAAHNFFDDITNELSHASYSGGSNAGIALTTKAITQISGKQYKFNSDNIAQAFTVTDATFKYAIFGERNATPGSAALVGYIDLNTGGGSITVTAGNTFTLNCPTNGWLNWNQTA